MKPRIFPRHNLLAKSINQVIYYIYFLTKYFTFLTKFRMLQIKSCSCSAIIFQFRFISETQVLMTVSNFSGFFLEIVSWKGALLFSGWREVVFQ